MELGLGFITLYLKYNFYKTINLRFLIIVVGYNNLKIKTVF